MIENQDLRLLNLLPEEMPDKFGRQSKYVELYQKIRRLPPGHSFYIDSKIKPNALRTQLVCYQKEFNPDFKFTVGKKVCVYKLPL